MARDGAGRKGETPPPPPSQERAASSRRQCTVSQILCLQQWQEDGRCVFVRVRVLVRVVEKKTGKSILKASKFVPAAPTVAKVTARRIALCDMIWYDLRYIFAVCAIFVLDLIGGWSFCCLEGGRGGLRQMERVARACRPFR